VLIFLRDFFLISIACCFVLCVICCRGQFCLGRCEASNSALGQSLAHCFLCVVDECLQYVAFLGCVLWQGRACLQCSRRRISPKIFLTIRGKSPYQGAVPSFAGSVRMTIDSPLRKHTPAGSGPAPQGSDRPTPMAHDGTPHTIVGQNLFKRENKCHGSLR
jgi:hypothetical protein